MKQVEEGCIEEERGHRIGGLESVRRELERRRIRDRGRAESQRFLAD